MREPDGKPAVCQGAGAPATAVSAVPNETLAACSAAAPRYRASGDFLIREIAGEIVMVPVGTGPGQLNGMLTVNESFRFLWEFFQQPHTAVEAAEAVAEQYDGTAEQIANDINNYMAETLKYGLLQEEEP